VGLTSDVNVRFEASESHLHTNHASGIDLIRIPHSEDIGGGIGRR